MNTTLIVRDNRRTPQQGVVVCIHGLGESSLSFAPLLTDPQLASWRVIAVDLPGYGRSPSSTRHAGLFDHVESVGTWVAGQNLGRVVVVGHSMGGVVALGCAERFPDLIRAIFDVEGNVTPDDCAYSAPISAIPEPEWPNPGFAAIRDRVWRAAQHDEAHRRYFASLAFADPEVLRLDALDLVAWSASGDLAARRARLAIPLEYLAGEPGGAGAASRAALDRAGVQWSAITPSGHWPFVDQYDSFVARLVAFLDRLPAGFSAR
jgi:pimeloyl-ACP methyl ester carboxylesterase